MFLIAAAAAENKPGGLDENQVKAVPGASAPGESPKTNCLQEIVAGDGKYHISIDTCDTHDLSIWATDTLAPIVREWYPKIIDLLPGEGFEAPSKVSVVFSSSMQGVADTSGTRIRCAGKWFRKNLNGEAAGSVVHELVHVVQQYGRGRRANPGGKRAPGWLVEGIADYIRWFLYEPQSHGADEVWLKGRKNMQLREDAGYRVTANFLNWVTLKYDKNLVRELNAAIRQGNYDEKLWKQFTGHDQSELGAEWKADVEQKLSLNPDRAALGLPCAVAVSG